MWSNVEEKITDGAAGLSPNAQPVVLFVGTSSKGGENSPYVIGKSSKLADSIGFGNLANAVGDCQKQMADVSVLACPSLADIGGIIGSVSKSEGAGILTVSGEPLFSATVTVEALSAEEVRVVLGGDKISKEELLIPQDKTITVEGLSLILPESLSAGDNWSFNTIAPTSSLEVLKKAVDTALEVYTPEAIIICQPSTAEEARYWGTEAENYFDDHKPVHIILYTELAEGEKADSISAKVKEFAKVDARFVSVLCQPGEVVDGSYKYTRQPLGFLGATVTKSAVNQSVGATRYFGVPNFTLPEGWTNADSRALDEARLLTLRTYAGLNGYYWSNGRTLAGDGSDYRFMEINRTVHKAVRLARRASLPYMHAPGDDIGIQEVLASIRQTLSTMTSSSPAQLTAVDVDAPEGQDIPNNGLQIVLALYGVPIIRRIVLNFAYKYQKES